MSAAGVERKEKIFGTDGVRGRANYEPMTVETALSLGRAAGRLFRSRGGRHRVVVGKDTRLSCYMFENALIAGLCSMGIDTLMLGPFPSPGVAFITRVYRADAGIVISASHNRYSDNGIKFFSPDGFKFPSSWEEEMEALVLRGNFSDSLPPDSEVGKNARVQDADGRYIEFVKSTFPRKSSLKSLRIALDCAHGAAYKVAPLVFWELEADIFVLGDEPNGLNINEGFGSLYPERVGQVVLDRGADVGISLDGDGDRLIMVDERGAVVDGDLILAICARYRHQKGLLKPSKVVGTVMSNRGMISALRRLGIQVVEAQVGDRNVLHKMLEQGLQMGGEPSGHLIFLDHNTTGDALIAALQVLQIMVETGLPLSELASFVDLFPQVQLNVPVARKPPLGEIGPVQKALKSAREKLGSEGRALLRYSGTEDLCRVMLEGPDAAQLNLLAHEIAQAIAKELGS